MEPSVIEEVRLTSFKSFRDAVLPLDAFTLLVGRNGSGKSNALDGLWALSRLAGGEDIRDALDGGREEPAVRGGVIGCAPFGEASFSLGCSVRTGDTVVHLDVTVQVEPVVQVIREELTTDRNVLLQTDPVTKDSADIVASWNNGRKGPNPKIGFRASRLLTTQVLSRVPATAAGQRIHAAAEQVTEALRSVFVLDPVPHMMRGYVPRRDTLLRRNADNVSAVIAAEIGDIQTKALLEEALSVLNEQQIADITISSSDLDDVILTLVEVQNGRRYPVPARLMSDGSLRFLAILAALLQPPKAGDEPSGAGWLAPTTLVIEELENGLHASQASTLISFIRERVKADQARALATAHSPALLDALTGEEHRSVIVCERDREGRSTLSRLVDLSGYLEVVAGGGLGKAAVADQLRATPEPGSARAFLDEVLGPR
jgi:predicted ATPase